MGGEFREPEYTKNEADLLQQTFRSFKQSLLRELSKYGVSLGVHARTCVPVSLFEHNKLVYKGCIKKIGESGSGYTIVIQFMDDASKAFEKTWGRGTLMKWG